MSEVTNQECLIEDGCQGTCSCNSKPHMEYKPDKLKLLRIGAGAVIFIITFVLNLPYPMGLALYLLSYLLIGGDVVAGAARNIVKGRVFDENFLMTVATMGAFAIKEFPEAVAVMLFYQIGEFFQDMAVSRSRKSISSLMDIRPEYANLKVEEDFKKVTPQEVKTGDTIMIKPGEKVPLDGRIIEGKSMLDTSALTGESLPRDVGVGDEVLSGSINLNGLLLIEVSREFNESTVARILELVENASSRKAPTENFITKFARVYTPAVVLSAVVLALVPPLIVPGAAFSDWINRALIFLVVSCPCALVISIPLSFFGGIGGASRNGILIKGGNYLEALNNIDTMVFDKTGTLTKGVFKVTAIKAFNNFTQEGLLEYTAYAESYSNHPIALSILKAYGEAVDKNSISDYEEMSGHGVKAIVQGKSVIAGNALLMEKENINTDSVDSIGTIIHVSVDGVYAGHIVISDEVREDCAGSLKALDAMGIKLAMLTGDNKAAAMKTAGALGIGEVYAELLPAQKVEILELIFREKSGKGKIAFIGDGINDAPVLARADIGIAMGALGSDAAIEAADVVLMTDEPSKIVKAVRIAKRTRVIVMQNIVFALGVKAIVLILSTFGVATMWEAVFADVGVALIAVLNAMRVMKQ